MADTILTRGATVTTLLTTTLEKRRAGKGIQDAVYNARPLLNWLHNEHRTTEDGGATILVSVMSEANGKTTFYDGFDTLNTQPVEGFTQAQYTWKQAAVPVSVSGRESEIQNTGPSAVIRLVDAKMKQADMDIRDTVNKAFFAASPGSKDIGSLVTSIDATSTIGEINSTNNSWWQSLVTTGGSFAAQGLSDMETTWNTLEGRGAKTGLIITENTTYGRYVGSLQPQQRFSGQVGNGTFANMMFKSAPVTFDLAATSGVMYFLDSNVLEFVVHKNRDFVPTEWVKPSNQDAKVMHILLGAELVVLNRRYLGKITSITD